MDEYSNRYLAYCRSHGLSPDDMLSVDSRRYQGGKMTGFLLWIGKQWSAFNAENEPTDVFTDHEKFDRWLLELYPELP